MSLSKFSLALICFIALTLALFQSSHAQNSAQDYVNAHNMARAAVGVGGITWSTTLYNYAQNYANQRISDCALVASGSTTLGENLGKGSAWTGVTAVNAWVGESNYYDYATNTCTAGKICSHYTQVIWKNSTSLGCARVQCTNTWYYVVCSYSPMGNVVGERPY